MKILIVKLSSLGDVIQTLPVLSSLKRKFSDAHISWLIEEEIAELIKGHPLVDQVIISRKNALIRGLRSPQKWAWVVREGERLFKEIRSCSYDLVIDFQGLLKSGILVGIAQGKRKIGFSPARESSHIFLSEKIPFPQTQLHAVDKYLSLMASLGCSGAGPDFFIPIHQTHRDRVLRFFQENKLSLDKPLILLHPGTRWETKLWEEKKWAELGDCLQEKNGAQVVFTGSTSDIPLISRITGMMRAPAISTAGKWGLNELAFLQKQADGIVIPDSGPMHLASAVGAPVVALFGPTDSTLTGPYGGSSRIIMKSFECQPCFKRKCSSHQCMREITVQEVCEAAEECFAYPKQAPRGGKSWQ